MVNTLVIVFLVLMFSGCQAFVQRGYPLEVVLDPGMKIEATNKNGTFFVKYVDSRTRHFGWNGNEKTVRMIARTERFPSASSIRSKGDLGIYHPATGRRYPRLVVREAIVHVDSMENLYRFLYQGSALEDWVYTRDGLMLGFSETPERNQINISLFQLLINGEKPSELKGARPQNITISHSNSKSSQSNLP